MGAVMAALQDHHLVAMAEGLVAVAVAVAVAVVVVVVAAVAVAALRSSRHLLRPRCQDLQRPPL